MKYGFYLKIKGEILLGKFEDLTGIKTGKLTVISRANNIGKKVAWNCICECGEESIVMSFNIKNGSTLSCGCYRKEVFLNEFAVYDDSSMVGYTNKGIPFFIDIEDYDSVKDKVWHASAEGYITTGLTENKSISLQRFLMNPPPHLQVDHRDRDTKNNRRSNLRICTNAINAKNRGIYVSNKSGVIGVWYNHKTKKWTAYITVDGSRKHLGNFTEFEEAVRVRREAEDVYFGEIRKIKNKEYKTQDKTLHLHI